VLCHIADSEYDWHYAFPSIVGPKTAGLCTYLSGHSFESHPLSVATENVRVMFATLQGVLPRVRRSRGQQLLLRSPPQGAPLRTSELQCDCLVYLSSGSKLLPALP
jgi:hypothetical protein